MLGKLNRIVFFFLAINLAFIAKQQAQLTINIISVPASTPTGENIYIAGNFNNWNPGHASYVLNDNGNGTYTISFTPAPGLVEYKFTRGSWATVEGNATGGFIPNRTINYAGGAQTVETTIAGWENESGGNHTAAWNVTLIDEDFYMPQLDRTRRIWICLPPDYESGTKAYPVIYMHDGQNLFDEYFSFAGEWKIDESMNELFENGDYGAIVVGIDNGGSQRINEYSSWIHPNYGGGDGELYAEFLVNTLKPFIDSNYRTLVGREYTAIAGSSMGANISIYTGIEYQDVFSKIGVFSPAFWFSDSIYIHVSHTGVREDMRVYFVAGDNESATILEEMGAMRDTLVKAGGNHVEMQWVHHSDGAHSEWYWAREFPTAYKWLFDDLTLGFNGPRIVEDFVSPNPADRFLRIHLDGANLPYAIYSLVGNVIRKGEASHDRIDLQGILPGMYFLEVGADNGAYYITRFIRQ